MGTDADRYKWVALSNVTLGVLLATLDASIVLIAMPDIFRGIHLSPLQPGNSFYLLWMILGYLVVTSVLVVGLGRLGDLYGRVRMYTARLRRSTRWPRSSSPSTRFRDLPERTGSSRFGSSRESVRRS